jgi:CRP-like cAMP-binding protein
MDDESRLIMLRNARLFVSRPDLRRVLHEQHETVDLAPNQLIRLQSNRDYVLRLGRLRLSEFLTDGRELGRGVLQTGSSFMTRSMVDDELPEADSFLLQNTVIMALGDAQLWSLPAGTFRSNDVY